VKVRKLGKALKTAIRITLSIAALAVILTAISIFSDFDIVWLTIASWGILCISLIPFMIIAIKDRNKYHKNEQHYYLQKLKQEEANPIITCRVCNNQISRNAQACPYCGEPMAKRCPKCNSSDVQRITGAEKGVTTMLVGPFAANTVFNDYYCKACNEKF